MTHRIEKRSAPGARLVNWTIFFDTMPSPELVSSIVEGEYPSAGYGLSFVSKPQESRFDEWVVFVQSNASCD